MSDRHTSARDRDRDARDGLTGVYLRGVGSRELDREVARAARTGLPLTVAFADVDGLKAINDRDGHAAGDRILIEVAQALRAAVRSYDLVIRFGGDEFLCVMAGLDTDGAKRRLRDVDTALAASPSHASLSMGVACLRPGDTARDLVARADAALYERKRERL